MSDTLNLALPYLAASQAQKHVTHNEALTLLDGLVQLSVKSRVVAAPPGSPIDGDRYLLPASPTGAWVGQAGRIALRMDGAWRFLAAKEGWTLWVDDEDTSLTFNGAAWNAPGVPSALQNLSLLGVNATADAGSKFSLASAASLFNHVGNGHQLKLNKNAAGDTASILFQTGFSGRAEFGTTGDDDFHVKVSSDGSAFNEALVITGSSGLVTAKKTVRLQPQTGDPASPVDGQLWYDQTSGVFRGRQNGNSVNLVGSGALTSGYANMSDGGTVAAAAGADTFKFRVGTGLAAIVASNDPTHGDNILLSLDVAGMTEDTAPDIENDELLTFDDSAAAPRRASPRNLAFQQTKAAARLGFEFFTDFIQETSATATDNGLTETISGTGAAAAAVAATAANTIGIAQCSTGTTATGRCALASSVSALRLGGGAWIFETHLAVPVLSGASERFQLLAGFIDTLTAANQADGVYFLYDEGGTSTGSAASGNWQCVSASNSVRSFSTTSTAVGTGFVRLTIEINAAGTSATFFVNGTLVATITTNIPIAAGRETGFGIFLIKSVGVTARVVNADYVAAACSFTTKRG